MRILGITDGVMAGAALVIDGRLVAAVSEERLCRLKMARGFPRQSIETVLRTAGVSSHEIDRVAVASTCEFFCEEVVPWEGWFQGDRGALSEAFRGAASKVVRVVGSGRPFQRSYYALKSVLTWRRRPRIRELLRKELDIVAPVQFFDHHLCHAASAYATAGHPRCLVFTLDGGGDGLSARIFRGRDGRLEPLGSIPAYDSIGNYYAYITHLAGFRAHRDEGKMSGLAAHGSPVYRDTLLSFIASERGTLRNRGRAYYASALDRLRRVLPRDARREDLAASMQSVLETEVGKVVAHWVSQSGESHLALAGGVFANVRLNQELAELDGVASLSVFPAMGDDGLSAGAALLLAGREAESRGETPPGESLDHVHLGPSFDDLAVMRALDAEGATAVALDRPAEVMADLLARGEVVARFHGAMEYGPRALGHRSLLYRPDDPGGKEWLNDCLRRTEFMPFAPVTTRELAGRCFLGLDPVLAAARFMTVTVPCSPEFRERCPGVVHVDGTARPQIVVDSVDPEYAEIVRIFHRTTGLPALVNTSFNMHEEPIVCSPEDALRAWREVGILHLFLGRHHVKKLRERSP